MPVTWDAADYRANSQMQHRLAEELIDGLDLTGVRSVLDVGCGDGRVTAALSERLPDGRVVGVDRSPQMIEHASALHPGIDFVVADATALPYDAAFDLVVSFTALHWVVDAVAALVSIRRALVHGGRLVATLPGAGNSTALFDAAAEVIAEPPFAASFAGFAFPWQFPTAAGYREALAMAGLEPGRVALVQKDVVHADRAALAGWVRTTWMPYTARVPVTAREALVTAIVERYAARVGPSADGAIHVAAVRLEVEAVRP